MILGLILLLAALLAIPGGLVLAILPVALVRTGDGTHASPFDYWFERSPKCFACRMGLPWPLPLSRFLG